MSSLPVAQEVYDAMLRTVFHDTTAKMSKNATDAISSFAEGDLLRTFIMGLKRYTKYPPVNVRNTRRLVASKLIEAGGYCF